MKLVAASPVGGLKDHPELGEDSLAVVGEIGDRRGEDLAVPKCLADRRAVLPGVGGAEHEGEEAEELRARDWPTVEANPDHLGVVIDHHSTRVVDGDVFPVSVSVEDTAHHTTGDAMSL